MSSVIPMPVSHCVLRLHVVRILGVLLRYSLLGGVGEGWRLRSCASLSRRVSPTTCTDGGV